MNYYNENDPKAAAWLRELIDCSVIPFGVVDTRSIVDVQPEDLDGFIQCHFFAGIGGWSYALQLAGWPEDREVWTGSCPCQPFSDTGLRRGTKDKRHLYPELHRLIEKRRPPVVFGEQVASSLGRQWLAGVRFDLEELGYAVGGSDLCAAGVAAPHRRQRLYWVAHHQGEGRPGMEPRGEEEQCERPRAGGGGTTGRMAHHHGERFAGRPEPDQRQIKSTQSAPRRGDALRRGSAGGLGHHHHHHHHPGSQGHPGDGAHGDQSRRVRATAQRPAAPAGAWGDFDILYFTDGKQRRVEAGTFPLAHGVANRVGLLRGYGNAIVPQVAAAFVSAYLDIYQ